MSKKQHKFRIDAYSDRKAITNGFLNSGYCVTIQDEPDPDYPATRTCYYVIVEEPRVRRGE